MSSSGDSTGSADSEETLQSGECAGWCHCPLLADDSNNSNNSNNSNSSIDSIDSIDNNNLDESSGSFVGSDASGSSSSSSSSSTQSTFENIVPSTKSALMREAMFKQLKEASRHVPVLQTADVWKDPSDGGASLEWRTLRDQFLQCGSVSPELAAQILAAGQAAFSAEPNVLKLCARDVWDDAVCEPCSSVAGLVLVGDVHGQLFDLVCAMLLGGDPADSETTYLFLGDYVDRGIYSIEVLLLLVAFKLSYPGRVWMLRGNHECRYVSSSHGFLNELICKYGDAVGEDLWTKANDLFDALPLAALYTAADGARIFCCHAGVSPLMSVADLDNLDRFQEIPWQGDMVHLVWSDPVEPSDLSSYNEKAELDGAPALAFQDLDSLPNTDRGISIKYGYATLAEFLALNNITSVVRAHQVMSSGFSDHSLFGETRAQIAARGGATPGHSAWPMVMTVFSAPDYCGVYDNAAALLKLPARPPDGAPPFEVVTFTSASDRINWSKYMEDDMTAHPHTPTPSPGIHQGQAFPTSSPEPSPSPQGSSPTAARVPSDVAQASSPATAADAPLDLSLPSHAVTHKAHQPGSGSGSGSGKLRKLVRRAYYQHLRQSGAASPGDPDLDFDDVVESGLSVNDRDATRRKFQQMISSMRSLHEVLQGAQDADLDAVRASFSAETPESRELGVVTDVEEGLHLSIHTLSSPHTPVQFSHALSSSVPDLSIFMDDATAERVETPLATAPLDLSGIAGGDGALDFSDLVRSTVLNMSLPDAARSPRRTVATSSNPPS